MKNNIGISIVLCSILLGSLQGLVIDNDQVAAIYIIQDDTTTVAAAGVSGTIITTVSAAQAPTQILPIIATLIAMCACFMAL